jgi:hypothetical protein
VSESAKIRSQDVQADESIDSRKRYRRLADVDAITNFDIVGFALSTDCAGGSKSP